MSGVKLVVAHSADCHLAEQGRDEFIVSGATLYRDRLGRRNNGSCAWYTFMCNNPDCPGTAAVRWDVLMDFIAEGLRSSAPNPRSAEREETT